jgi:osmoprotectant transport system ATP-binding protein
MLMDEPFGALDAITRMRLQDEFRMIQQRLHKTIVFVTHDVDEALRLADRIAVMRAGRIVQRDRPLAMVTRPHDDFVRRLLTSDDVLRQLGLTPVAAVMGVPASTAAGVKAEDRQETVASGDPVVYTTDSLRTALSLLLQSGSRSLTVVGNGGSMLGRITFEDIHRAVLAGREDGSR